MNDESLLHGISVHDDGMIASATGMRARDPWEMPRPNRRVPPAPKPIAVGKDQPTADLLQQHITVTVSAEKSDGITPGPVDAELSRTFIDLGYSQAGYDPTAGECEPIKVYFCEAGYSVWVKATPEKLAGNVWRIWLEVTEVTCGE